MFDFHKTVFIHAILHNKMPKCKKITRIHKKHHKSGVSIQRESFYISITSTYSGRLLRAEHRTAILLMRFGTGTS